MARPARQRNAGRARRGVASASSRSCTPPCCTQPSAHGSSSSSRSAEGGTRRSCRWQHARARRRWLAPVATSRRLQGASRSHRPAPPASPAPFAPLAPPAAPPAAPPPIVPAAFDPQSAAGRPDWQPPIEQAPADTAASSAAPAAPAAALASPLVDLVGKKLRPPPPHPPLPRPPPQHLPLPRVGPSLAVARESVGRG
eukprot:scaffold16314_cov62-Phaeocystis_antarctica.AAC.2